MGKPANGDGEDLAAAKSLHDAATSAIKAEIERRGLTYYRISKDTGISSAALSRFRKPGGTIKSESLFMLLDYLGVRMVCDDENSTVVLFEGRGNGCQASDSCG
ncbi:MAG: helix-turn-helix domain-containing protein [Thermoguttaceae bacterium]|nr:helix-turn-helix domain-containing protein [Thermoguttaceae bacterium]